jgi:hypothetical protein
MNLKKFVFACGIALAIIGLSIYCNSSNPAAPATNGLVGVWTGALSNRGGGGPVFTHGRDSIDASGNVVFNDFGDTLRLDVVDSTNASGDTIWKYDSMGVVLNITQTKFSLVRGEKNWGSSDYGRDSLKSVGSWKIAGNKAIFTPTDSCLWRDETHLWTEDDGLLHACLPPDTLMVDTTSNTWNTPIINSKLAKYQSITLVRQ